MVSLELRPPKLYLGNIQNWNGILVVKHKPIGESCSLTAALSSKLSVYSVL